MPRFRHAAPFELIWELEPEGTAFAVLRIDPETSLVEFHDLTDQRQSETGTFTSLASTNLGLDIWRE